MGFEAFFHQVLIFWGFGLDVVFLGILPHFFPDQGLAVSKALLPFLPPDAEKTEGGALPPLFRAVSFFAFAWGIPRGFAGLYPHQRGVWLSAVFSVFLEASVFLSEYLVSGSRMQPFDLGTPVSLYILGLGMLAFTPPRLNGGEPAYVGGVIRHHWIIRLANALLAWVPLPKLDANTIIKEACQKEGLTDFGKPDGMEPAFKHLCECLEKEARLSPIGRLATRYDRLPGILRERLRIVELLKKHPEIRNIPVKAPVVVTGLARSGTTLLHRLVASDPRFRGPQTWELTAPSPGPAEGRKKKAADSIEAVKRFFPAFMAAHPIEADNAEEEVMLLDFANWLSPVPESVWRVPSWGKEQESSDNLPAYETLKLMLQVLSFERGNVKEGDNWLLKTPHHLWFFDHLFKVFPDAKVIVAHREPKECLPSICSLISITRSIMSDDVDPREVGATWTKKVYAQLDRSTEFRERHGAGKCFIDVKYKDLMSDPIGVVRKIYAGIGLNFSEEVAQRVQAQLDSHPKNRFGAHKYTAEMFGINNAETERRFESYNRAYL
eukprot:Hpha_TRINITY_DN16194_c6_g2::TRINITY_DN16194_c6_g2_i2::g.7143::m.7143